MKKKKKPKSTGRPSKLTTEVAIRVFVLSRRGFTDEEIANVLTIKPHFVLTGRTINNWKKQPAFFQSLKENKEYSDQMVERSLFERAMGYSCPEDTILSYKGRQTQVVRVEKFYPPDVTACIFWLKNRKADAWREKAAEGSEVTHHHFFHEVIRRSREKRFNRLQPSPN